MMEVGFSEILLISVLALIVLGPEKLPKVAAEIGRWVGRARAMARQFRDQLEDEASLEPTIRKPAANSGAATAGAGAASAPAAEATTTSSAANAGASPAQHYATPEDWAANHGASTEITPDHAELNPHPPMPDDYIPGQDMAAADGGGDAGSAHAADAVAANAAHAEPLPRP